MMVSGTVLFLLLSAAVPIFAEQNHTDEPHIRQRRELSSMISDLAGQFFRSGGQRGVDELSGSNDQMGVLKRYLGSALAGMVFGGSGNDLVSSILGGRGSSSSSSGGSGGYRPSATGSASSGSYSGNTGGRTGVSVVDNQPGQRRTSSGSTGYGSDGSDTSGRRRPSSGSRDSADFEPQAGSNSKTGVSIINSRPDDRPRRPSGTTASNRNVDIGDYDTDGVSGSSRGTEREQTGGRGYGRYSGNRRDDYK